MRAQGKAQRLPPMTEPDHRIATAEPVAPGSSVGSFQAALRCAQILASLTLLLGVVVLCGWASHNERLETIFPGYVSMKANTALCFALSALSLWLGYLSSPRPWKRRCSQALAILVVLISVLTLISAWIKFFSQTIPMHPTPPARDAWGRTPPSPFCSAAWLLSCWRAVLAALRRHKLLLCPLSSSHSWR